MMKYNRHKLILEMVAQKDIETQEELAAMLQAQGIKVTQATVSRDIRELNLTKVTGENGRQKYIILDAAGVPNLVGRYARLLSEAVISTETAKNILVLKTNPGLASAVGAAVDVLGLTNLVGTLAGDDTVFCAFADDPDALAAKDELRDKIAAGLEEQPDAKRRRRRQTET